MLPLSAISLSRTEDPPPISSPPVVVTQGCWHVPAGADHEWLCIDVQRGLRMGLDKLMPTPRKTRANKNADIPPGESNDGGARDVAMVRPGGGARAGGAEDDTLRKVRGAPVAFVLVLPWWWWRSAFVDQTASGTSGWHVRFRPLRRLGAICCCKIVKSLAYVVHSQSAESSL